MVFIKKAASSHTLTFVCDGLCVATSGQRHCLRRLENLLFCWLPLAVTFISGSHHHRHQRHPSRCSRALFVLQCTYKSAMCSDPRRIPPINPQSKCFANNTHIFQIAFLNVKISLQNTINNSQFVFVFLFLRIFISCVYRRIRCYMSCIHINRRFCSTYSHQTG